MTIENSSLPGADRPADKAAGHWLLARVGKKVLRPGGRETTTWLLDHLPIQGKAVVELAPGLGVTAREILTRNPAAYTAVDADSRAVAMVSRLLTIPDHRAIVADAGETGLDDAHADVVIGEAMLTMQSDRHKLDIMREAARILRPGGRYAIHELGLTPDDLDEATKEEIRRQLAHSIRVNARPLTVSEWTSLAEEAGFRVTDVYSTSMGLLDPRRMVADEGVIGTLRIIVNVVRQPDVRRRVLAMRQTFRRNRDHLSGIGMILTRT